MRNQRNIILLTYALGIFGGTVLANVLSGAYIERARIFQIYYDVVGWSGKTKWVDVIFQLTCRRGMIFLLLNLAFNSTREQVLVPAFGFVYGLSLATLVALSVRVNGSLGIFLGFFNCFPHMLFYIAAWMVLQNGFLGYRLGKISSKTVCIGVTIVLFYLGIFSEIFLSQSLYKLFL